jgi:RimJ/RimL family protein N-acetyltransferase
MNYTIRPKQDSDNEAINAMMLETWHTLAIISRAKFHPIIDLPCYVAESVGKLVGLVGYEIIQNQCEVVILQSMIENQGIGTKLMQAVIDTAKKNNCTRVWLITTNDNLHSMHFYQKLGFSFSALYRNAMEVSRKMKPQIPLTGREGIPLRDEIEFELIIN